MRKIDKSHIISTKYKEWEESLNDKHPYYDSSKNKFYYDVVMNLFYVQKGVCAYTEVLLCDEKYFHENNWKNGKYSISKPQFDGDLEHFAPNLKELKSWSWDNFFMVHTNTNRRKGTLPVDDILKPDNPLYNPFNLLEYDEEIHFFIANTDLSEDLQKRVNNMILTLGINYSSIVKKRKEHIIKIYSSIKSFMSTWEKEETQNYQFFTALEMFKRIKQDKQ